MNFYEMKLFLLFLFIYPFCLYAQLGNEIRALDSISFKELSNVKLLTDSGSFYSDSNGVFSDIHIKENTVISFDKLGYKKKWIDYKRGIDTILLVQDKSFLQEYKVVDEIPGDKTYEIGYHNQKHFFRKTLNVYRKSITAVYIAHDNPQSIIDKIILKLRRLEKDQKITVYLFGVSRDGKPGNIMFKKSITNDSIDWKGRIDISEEGIRVPREGIFIGVEHMHSTPYGIYKKNPSDYGVEFHCTNRVKHRLAYVLYKDLRQKSKNNKWSQLTVGEQPLTPCFGLQMHIK